MYSGGEGTLENPYLIKTVQDFDNIRAVGESEYYFKQVKHLDFSKAPNFETMDFDRRKTTIHYDGNNFNISNLTCDMRGKNKYACLVHRLEKFTMCNITFKNCFFHADNYLTSSLIGWVINEIYCENVRVRDCEFIVESDTGIATGIACESDYTTLIRCSVLGCKMRAKTIASIIYFSYENLKMEQCFSENCEFISTTGLIGGLINTIGGSTTVRDCYTKNITVSNDVWEYGGIVNSTYNNLTDLLIERCYVIGNVNAYDASVGGLIYFINASTDESVVNIRDSFVLFEELNVYEAGQIYGGYRTYGSKPIDEIVNVSGCYHLDGVSYDIIQNTAPITKEQALTKQTYVDATWDFEDVWGIKTNDTPFLKRKSTGQLEAMPLTSITVVS